MKVLLDTCTFLWVLTDDPMLSADATRLVRDTGNQIFLSAVSAWEISIKHNLGRLPLPRPPEIYVRDMREAHRIESLPLDEEAALYDAKLPKIHRDPFDRMLVCQSIVGGIPIVTPDQAIAQYPIRTLW